MVDAGTAGSGMRGRASARRRALGLAAMLVPILAWVGWAGLAVATASPAGAASPAESDSEPRLFQWTDAEGVVRYTPDPGRIPRARRDTMVPVEPDPEGRLVRRLGPRPDWLVDPARPARPDDREPTFEELAAAEPTESQRLGEQIRALEEAIARDEEALKVLISAPDDPQGGDALRDSPELREIARRLPELQAEVELLRERRARAQRRPPPTPGAAPRP